MAGANAPSRREGFLEALLGAVADVPVYIFDRELRAVQCFWEGDRAPWGLKPSEFLGRRAADLVRREEAAAFDRALQEVFDTGKRVRFEGLFSLPVGPRWFEVRLSPIRAADGTVEYLLAASYDITEHRRAAEALRESQRRFETLAESVPVGIIWRTLEGRPLYRNRVAERLSGFTTEELERGGWQQGVHPDDVATLARVREQVLESPQALEYEVRLVRPDGLWTWVLASTAPTLDDEGRVTGLVTTFIDISGRRAIEEALRESEQRFQSLAEALAVGVWRTDREARLVYANRRVWEFLDVEPAALEDGDVPALLERMEWEGRLVPGEAGRMLAQADRAMRERFVNSWPFDLTRSDGSVRHFQSVAVSEYDFAGTFIGRVGALIDVTDLASAQQELARHRDHLGELVAERTLELERSYEALRRSERLAAVGTFAAGIAHQINNPVGGILLAAQFALENPGDRERVETALRNITADARHCGRIVRGVLEFARGPTSDSAPVNLNQVALECVRKLTPDAMERSAKLRLDLDPELPPAMGGALALEQAVTNLVYNSIEAGAKQIVISTQAAADGVEIAVRDDGCGIEGENIDRIFDPLFTTRASVGGTGLGLALARGVVEACGGTIEVKSEGSAGTEVRVRLQRAPASAPPV